MTTSQLDKVQIDRVMAQTDGKSHQKFGLQVYYPSPVYLALIIDVMTVIDPPIFDDELEGAMKAFRNDNK